MLSHTGVGPLAEQIARRHTAAFDHIAQLTDNVPARLALRCQIDASLGRLTSNIYIWKRPSWSSKEQMARPVRQDSAALFACGFVKLVVLE